MELDDFKNSWKSEPEATSTSKNKIMELMQHKSYGPVAVLKAELGRQFIAIPFVYAILVWQVMKNPALKTDPFFGLFLWVVVIASVFFAIAYFRVEKMSRADSPVKANLERQLGSLQTIFLCYRITAFAGAVILAVFLEVFRHQGTALLIPEWYELALGVRLCGYVLLLIIVFFAARAMFHRQFGRHLQQLRELARQLD